MTQMRSGAIDPAAPNIPFMEEPARPSPDCAVKGIIKPTQGCYTPRSAEGAELLRVRGGALTPIASCKSLSSSPAILAA